MSYIEETFKVQIFMGTSNRVLKCTHDTLWKGIAYKIPREKVQECMQSSEKEFKHSGVYILIGKLDDESTLSAYVGKTEGRSTDKIDEGIVYRLQEQVRSKKWWTEAIAITSVDNVSLGATEVGYLEYRLSDLARKAKHYRIKGNGRGCPRIHEDKKVELEQFVRYILLTVELFGHNIFVPKATIGVSNNTSDEIYCLTHSKDKQGNNKQAKLKYKKDGSFLLLAGSYIRPIAKSMPLSAMKIRQVHSIKINKNGLLGKSILFDNLSKISSFVLGSSSNGKNRWKTDDGKTLK